MVSDSANKLKYTPGLKVEGNVADWSYADSVTRKCFVIVFLKDRATRDDVLQERRIPRNSVWEGNQRNITRGEVLNDRLAG